MPHDNGGKAIQMPNCVASVWRVAEIGKSLGYGNSNKGNPTERHRRLQGAMKTANVPQFRREQRSRSCKLCESGNRRNSNGKVAIHFPGLEGLNKPIVWLFPKLLSCLDCGFTESAIPETELRQLQGSGTDLRVEASHGCD